MFTTNVFKFFSSKGCNNFSVITPFLFLNTKTALNIKSAVIRYLNVYFFNYLSSSS